MLNLYAKYHNSKLTDDNVIQFRDDSVKLSKIRQDLQPIYDVFFTHDIEFKIVAGWSRARYKNSTGGFAQVTLAYIEMFAQKYGSYAEFLQNCFHELGHMHHYIDNSKDFWDRTHYGRELYAEDFAALCMGDKYSVANGTNLSCYDGYKTRTIYNKTSREIIKNKIAPLTE